MITIKSKQSKHTSCTFRIRNIRYLYVQKIKIRQIAEVTGTFDGVGGNKCETTKEHCKLYSKERHTGGLAGQLDGKSLLYSYYLAYGVSGQHTTFTSCQNAACSVELFSPAGRWVDYD